jgi:nucleoside-diphosphate-sugar epimerase
MRFENVLVTGAGGMLGRHVVEALRQHCRVTGYDLKLPPWTPGSVPVLQGDMLDREALRRAVQGQDAIVHIAAVPNIWSGSGDHIMSVNVTGTWNLLAAAEEAGVRRVVLCSSDSVVGFTVREGRMIPPDYLPVDHLHPLRPTDPYALSKQLGEETGRSFAARGVLEVIALRPVFILFPEMHVEVRARARDPRNYRGPTAGGPSAAGGGPVWHHVDPRDLARAFRLALDLDRCPFTSVFISAAVTLAPEPTLDRLARFLDGRLPELRRPALYQANPYAPLYDTGYARELLGFEPEHDARVVLTGIAPAT